MWLSDPDGNTEIVTSESLIKKPSAQLAELLALTAALQQATGKTANIYIDSAYVCGVVHVEVNGRELATEQLAALQSNMRRKCED